VKSSCAHPRASDSHKHWHHLQGPSQTAADWLFLVGSILFAVKPTIDVARSMHLKKLPGQSDGPSHHTPASAGDGS